MENIERRGLKLSMTTGKSHPRMLVSLPASLQVVISEERTTFHLAPRVVLRVRGCKTELTLHT